MLLLNTLDVALVGAVDCVRIVTVNEQLDVFPAPSVAVQVTVAVAPTVNVLPDAGEHATVAEQLSVAVGVAQVATGLH